MDLNAASVTHSHKTSHRLQSTEEALQNLFNRTLWGLEAIRQNDLTQCLWLFEIWSRDLFSEAEIHNRRMKCALLPISPMPSTDLFVVRNGCSCIHRQLTNISEGLVSHAGSVHYSQAEEQSSAFQKKGNCWERGASWFESHTTFFKRETFWSLKVY